MQRSQTEIHADPRVKAARSRLLFLWTWAHDTELYVKKDWQELSYRLDEGEEPDAVMADAELLYESSQDDEWPSLLTSNRK